MIPVSLKFISNTYCGVTIINFASPRNVLLKFIELFISNLESTLSFENDFQDIPKIAVNPKNWFVKSLWKDLFVTIFINEATKLNYNYQMLPGNYDDIVSS